MPSLWQGVLQEVVSMAEFKQYVTHVKDNGRILVSEDVISTLAINALTDIEGYAGLDVKPGADIVELIGSKSNWGKGVKVIVSEVKLLL